jgi:hypothetical protein
MFYRLAAVRGSRQGAYCGREGLYLADTPLIRREGGHYLSRPDREIALLLSAAYGRVRDFEGIPGELARLPRHSNAAILRSLRSTPCSCAWVKSPKRGSAAPPRRRNCSSTISIRTSREIRAAAGRRKATPIRNSQLPAHRATGNKNLAVAQDRLVRLARHARFVDWPPTIISSGAGWLMAGSSTRVPCKRQCSGYPWVRQLRYGSPKTRPDLSRSRSPIAGLMVRDELST